MCINTKPTPTSKKSFHIRIGIPSSALILDCPCTILKQYQNIPKNYLLLSFDCSDPDMTTSSHQPSEPSSNSVVSMALGISPKL